MTNLPHLYPVKVSNTFGGVWGVILLVCLACTSCFKKDIVIKLPPKTGATTMQVRMGAGYDTCYYISLENGKVAGSHLITDWDLRFDATPSGHVVLMNSGNHNSRIIATAETDMKAAITAPPISITWGFDPPTSWQDSAYVRNWQASNGASKNEVYIFRQGDAVQTMQYFKFQIVSVTNAAYTILADSLNGTQPRLFTIPKFENKNFAYFSFANGGSVKNLEPNKTDWDLVCMPYHSPFYNNTPFLYYQVTGILSNSYNTLCGGDTAINTNFTTFTLDSIGKYPLNNFVGTIGYNWKKPDNNYNYVTFPNYVYVVKTQQGHLYKLHFTSFYFQGVEKGAPKFEFERML